MSDKFFLDSNVCVYAFDIDSRKKAKALDLIVGSQATVSTQVLMETANVATKKLKFKQEDVQLSVDYIAAVCSLHVVRLSTISLAFQVTRKHQYALYDALIIASALESGCSILYTEDMQHGHLVDNRLKIVNPFL